MSRSVDDRSLGGRVAAFTVLGLAVLIGGAWLVLYVHAGDRAPRSASVEGVRIAGLRPTAAEQALRHELAKRATQPIVVSYGDGRTSSVDPASAGLSVDYTASVVAAGGGAGWSPQRLWEVASGGGDHRAVVQVDETKMQAALDSLAGGIAQPPVDGTIAFTSGRAQGVPGKVGYVVDRSAARAMLVQRFLRQGSQKLPTRLEPPAVTADEVNRVLGSFGRPAMSGPVTILLAGQRVVAPPRLFGRALSMRVEGTELVPQVDSEVLMKALAPVTTVGTQPVDAGIEVREGRPVVVPARLGVQYDADLLESLFTAALTHQGAARRIVVPGQVRQPSFTTAAARATKVVEPVSTFTARFPHADHRNANLARAAALLDGTLVRPGQQFSLNGVLGERTSANGFTEGTAIADATSGKDAGGDVSSLATALFNAAFFAGLGGLEHTAPRFHDQGSPVGRDAALVWPTGDLGFTDDSPYGVLVTVSVHKASPRHDGSVTVTMWSKKRWDVSARTGPRTQVVRPAVRYVRTRSCQARPGNPGFGVDVVRVLRRPGSAKVLRTQTFHTDYLPGEAVRCGSPPKA